MMGGGGGGLKIHPQQNIKVGKGVFKITPTTFVKRAPLQGSQPTLGLKTENNLSQSSVTKRTDQRR